MKIRLSPPLLYTLLIGLFLCCAGLSQVLATPKAPWMFDDIVEADFVMSKISVPMPDDVMLIDSRPYRPKYVKGFIPGAVSIPYSEFDEKKDLLPKNKNTLLIFYCGGEMCKLSHKSAKKAVALGYTNVKVFAKGFPEYKKLPGAYRAVEAETVAAAISENRALIVDSRPKEPKYDKGHIPSAISLPFSKFDELKGKLPRALDTPIIFYCGGLSCRLSHKSAARALVMGYRDVAVFTRGYPEWKKLYGEGGGAAVKAGDVEGSIDLDRFKKILSEAPDSIRLIDVRDADEFAKAHMASAVNIPVEELEAKIKALPSDKPVVYICSTGARSGEAYYMTLELRPELTFYYVEATVDFKKDGSFTLKKN